MAYNDDGSEGGPRGTFEIFRAEGDSLYKNGEYRKAIDSYNCALELRENDRDCLVARSRCYLMLGDNDNAFKDAELSLEEDNMFHKGIYQKAEALYQKGDFEWALVYYHRGHKLRPELNEFRLGIQKAKEAIDNAVGSPESVQLTKEGDLAYFEQQANDNKPAAKGGRAGQYNRPASRDGKRSKKEPPKSAAKDKTVKQLLGEMYGDRIYLEMLLKETVSVLKCFKDEVNSLIRQEDTKSNAGRTVYDLAYDGINYLDRRTEFWRQQKPMYARKRDRLQRRADHQGHKESPNKYIVKELEKIDEEQSEGRFEDSLKRAKKCLKTIEGYPEDAIQNRAEVMSTLHSNIGNAYLELGDLSKAQAAHQKDYEIGDEYDLEESKSRALDNLGRVYARQGEYEKAIKAWERKVPLAKTPLEKTWLYHEIGRCHLEMDNFQLAKDYGDKSVAAANEAADEMWQLNATVLVAQSEVKCNDLQAALGSFENALDMAKVQKDEAAESAIRKAIDDVNSKIVKSIKEDNEDGGDESPKGEQEQEERKSPEEQETTKEEPTRSPTPEKAPSTPDQQEDKKSEDENEKVEEIKSDGTTEEQETKETKETKEAEGVKG